FRSEKGVRVRSHINSLLGMLSTRYNLTLFYLFEFEQNVRNTVISVYPEYPTRRQNEGRFSLLSIKLLVS
ncbi:MAG TPA: hypothetical protein VKA49_08850, partial [Flavitalea sp.]|nr:hypothetical protein [Flavitalea sp.]